MGSYWHAALLMFMCGAGCVTQDTYVCASDSNCVQGAVQGSCESQGFCSFPAEDCESGRRFESKAGDTLAGSCVVDTPELICGGLGEACCADDVCQEGACGADSTCQACGGIGQPCCTDNACGSNAACEAGTCEQCALDIGLGRRHSCLLKADGSVWCVGDNAQGKLGNNSEVASSTPVQVTALAGAELITDATAIGVGKAHSCAIRTGGTVWCWGLNGRGQLGDGLATPMVGKASAVQVLKEIDNEPLGGIIQIQVADAATYGLDSAGQVWSWGSNAFRQLGNNTVVSRAVAAEVLTALDTPLVGAVELRAGAEHVCVIRNDQTVWCWGSSSLGEVGVGVFGSVGFARQAFSDAIALDTGRRHTCAVSSDSTMSCWGNNLRGRIGVPTGSGNDYFVLSPISVETMEREVFTGFTDLAMGAVSCGITQDKRVWCWGYNNHGQTGTGGGSRVPTLVTDLSGAPLESVARLISNFAGVCAYLEDGSVQCWGRNSESQLPISSTTNVGYPSPALETCP